MNSNEENHIFDKDSPLLQGIDPVISGMESRIQKLEAEKDSVEDVKDKRRKDWSEINKWLVGAMIALASLVLFQLSKSNDRIDDFHQEAREIRERLSTLETKFNYEMEAKVPPAPPIKSQIPE